LTRVDPVEPENAVEPENPVESMVFGAYVGWCKPGR
jgi:hypothetical protein